MSLSLSKSLDPIGKFWFVHEILTDVGLFRGKQAAFSLVNPLVSIPSYLLWSYCFLDTCAEAEQAYWKEQSPLNKRAGWGWMSPDWPLLAMAPVKLDPSILCLKCRNATRSSFWWQRTDEHTHTASWAGTAELEMFPADRIPARVKISGDNGFRQMRWIIATDTNKFWSLGFLNGVTPALGNYFLFGQCSVTCPLNLENVLCWVICILPVINDINNATASSTKKKHYKC